MELSNPRLEATVENWPSGRNRVTAIFEVETNKKGSRVLRYTTGKAVKTNYYLKACLVDGSDGRIYVAASTEYGQMVLIPGTIKKDLSYYYKGEEMYDKIEKILSSL